MLRNNDISVIYNDDEAAIQKELVKKVKCILTKRNPLLLDFVCNILVTFVFHLVLQDKENPEYALELRRAESEYDKKRIQLQIYFG